MRGFSVITIVKNREKALKNLVRGLINNEVKPDELVVVHMNEEPYSLGDLPFRVKSSVFLSDIDCPLAAARNTGAELASFDRLIFLDVDCIPGSDYIKCFETTWEDNSLLSGTVRYLSAKASFSSDLFLKLDYYSKADPLRSNLNILPYELFWSLNFGCSSALFRKIGRFDENYLGYGAEDTDFSFAARKENVPLKIVKAVAYHQHHAAFSPPLNHLNDIVPNATMFHKKWKVWPMEGWLKQFEEMGLVNWNDDCLEVLRQPTAEELAKSIKD